MLSLFSFRRLGGKDSSRRNEKMKEEWWRGERRSQGRGNGDRSIGAKRTGLL